jgi:anti-anti-sigma factor
MATSACSSVTGSRRSLGSYAERDADRTVVWLRGEHDLSTVEALSETMARAIALDDADVVVDLSEVHFMSAATVGVIIRAREFLRLESRSLALRSPSKCAGRVIDLCGLGDLFDPRAADAMRLTGTAGALSTWVAVPTAARGDRPTGSATATRNASPADVDQARPDRMTNAASRQGP